MDGGTAYHTVCFSRLPLSSVGKFPKEFPHAMSTKPVTTQILFTELNYVCGVYQNTHKKRPSFRWGGQVNYVRQHSRAADVRLVYSVQPVSGSSVV
jgi:hypothetical protein